MQGTKTSEEIRAAYARSVGQAIYRYTEVVFERGEGSTLYDPEGRAYIDLAAGIATNVVGHGHPAVLEAVERQVRKLVHAASHIGYYAPYAELAERLKAHVPGALREGKVIFVNSGSEAVEAAAKLARMVTGRSTILAFLGGFHGRPMGALGLTASNAGFRRSLTGLLPGVQHAPYPSTSGRRPSGLSVGTAEALSYVEELLATTLPPSDLAAILVEPIQGEGGLNIPGDGFLEGLRKIADRTGALLIADEVQTGLGRTGRFLAMEHWGVEPDVVVLAKALGAGFPLGGVLARREIMDAWPPASHGTTFGGNPVALVAGAAAIDVIDREGLVERAGELGARAVDLLREATDGSPLVGDVRGKGLLFGVEIRGEDGLPDGTRAQALVHEVARRGAILTKCGPATLRFSPALTIGRDELERGVEIVATAIREAV
jgi:4-aminobutyrate aminotransferase